MTIKDYVSYVGSALQSAWHIASTWEQRATVSIMVQKVSRQGASQFKPYSSPFILEGQFQLLLTSS